ncbi:hypothetical protein E2C01_011617 [Portunus trituberculatus]|uniref:Uncharacterized protein n=1 Tax=Portunus trituberculatus TaxID=210409 RepID=A0A5B7DBS5_PORTR|nr:hypothetical protein [Portunus trituberculatus]
MRRVLHKNTDWDSHSTTGSVWHEPHIRVNVVHYFMPLADISSSTLYSQHIVTGLCNMFAFKYNNKQEKSKVELSSLAAALHESNGAKSVYGLCTSRPLSEPTCLGLPAWYTDTQIEQGN